MAETEKCTVCGAAIDEAKPFIACAKAADGQCPHVTPGAGSVLDGLLAMAEDAATASVSKVADSLNHDDPGPQLVGKGRLHRLSIECYVPEGVDAAHIVEFVSAELGCGGIGRNNPLFHGSGFDVRDVEHLEDTGLNGYTLWNALGEDCEPGHRHGRTILRKAGEPLGVVYEQPAASPEAGDKP